MAKPREIKGFGGVICAYEQIPINHSADQVNVRTEDGSIRPRYGYRKLRAPGAGFSAIWGAEYLHGYDSSRAEQEEIVTFETRSGNTRAYSNNVLTGAATEITNSGSSVNLHASEWVSATFRGDAFFINPNNASPVYRHAIGDATSLTAIAIPDAPTTRLTYTVKYGGGSTPYTQIAYTGLDPATEITYTGAAHATDSSVESDGSLIIGHTGSDIDSSFELDLNGAAIGVLDCTYNDAFGVLFDVISAGLTLQIRGVELRNNDGTPKKLVPDQFKVNQIVSGSTTSYAIRFEFTDKIRADFDNIRYVKILYSITHSNSGSANQIRLSKLWLGGVDMRQPRFRGTPGTEGLWLSYSYYFSSPGWESGIAPSLFIPNSVCGGYSPTAGIDVLGTQIEVTATVSADANVDNIRYYVQDNPSGLYYRIATQADSDLTFDIRLNSTEIIKLTQYTPTPFTFGNITAAFAHKSFMVWLYKGGRENVRGSRVGDAIRQSDTTIDTDEDLDRGRTMSLSDDFGDEPLGGVSVGGAFMIAGKVGIYVSFGDYPAQLTPIRKVTGSTGAAGKYAFCRWKDDNGVTGIVYVSTSGQVYFAVPTTDTGDNTREQVQLSEVIREGVKSLKTWLLDGQAALGITDFSTVQVRVDDRENEIVIAMGKRAVKLKRPNFQGVRSWDPENYNTGADTATIRFLTSSTKYGIRWVRSTGYLDEDNFDNSSRQYIEGVNRDGGNPMPPGYWKTQPIDGENRRILQVLVDREPMIEQRVRIHSARRTQIYKPVAFRSYARCLIDQQGRQHEFEIIVTEETGRITRLYWDESPLAKRLNS